MVRKEVLILDGDADQRALIRKILENTGMLICEAASVAGALALLHKHIPHLVIADLNIKGENGTEFLRRKSMDASLRQIPVIILNAPTKNEAQYRSIPSGTCEFISKPFNTIRLLQRVRRAISEHSSKKVRFGTQNRPTLTHIQDAKVTRISDATLTLESPVKLAPGTRITLHSEPIAKLGFQNCIYRTSSQSPITTQDDNYSSIVKIIGVQELVLTTFRKRVTRWI